MRGLLIGAGIFGVGAYLAKRKPSPAQPVLDEAAEPEPVEESPGFSLGYAPTIPVREAFDPDVWASSKVTPARFYAVRKGDTIPKIAARLVRETALDAARGRKMPKDTARQWADQLSRSHGLIRQAEDLINLSGWNDEVFGSPALERTGHHGRAVDVSPVHDDVAEQLGRGDTPRRNLSADGEPTNPGRRSRPFLWIPGTNPEIFASAMIDKKDVQAMTCHGVSWDDGSSTMWPPPLVTERGVIHG